MNEVKINSNNYVAHEYKEIITEAGNASQYLDGFTSFGWIPDNTVNQMKNESMVILRFKRERKIMNKAELTRLQRHYEVCMNQIKSLEKSRTSMATSMAIAVGIVGTVFMAGSTFAVVNDPPMIWLCVLLAIPGFIGWILPYFVFKSRVHKRTEIVTPLIDNKFEEIYEICTKGRNIIGK